MAIARGDNNRVVAAMQMNPRSSRGHGIVALHVLGEDGLSFGRLTLCDLAGMESSKKSAAVDTGPSSLAIRKEEAKRINISLLALSGKDALFCFSFPSLFLSVSVWCCFSVPFLRCRAATKYPS